MKKGVIKLQDSSSLPRLFKSENVQLEKLRRLEIGLRTATHDELPAFESNIDAVMEEISRLVGAIQVCQTSCLAATPYQSLTRSV
jgi:hypothetical protein